MRYLRPFHAGVGLTDGVSEGFAARYVTLHGPGQMLVGLGALNLILESKARASRVALGLVVSSALRPEVALLSMLIMWLLCPAPFLQGAPLFKPCAWQPSAPRLAARLWRHLCGPLPVQDAAVYIQLALMLLSRFPGGGAARVEVVVALAPMRISGFNTLPSWPVLGLTLVAA